jgi:hypothetical protein
MTTESIQGPAKDWAQADWSLITWTVLNECLQALAESIQILNQITYCLTLQALTNVWWQNIEKNIGCSETKFGVLSKNLHTVFGSCFWQWTGNILHVLQLFYLQTLIKNSIPVLPKNIGSVVFACFVENHHKYMCNYFTMFNTKSLAKLCLRAPYVFSNVLPPNICQWMQCK